MPVASPSSDGQRETVTVSDVFEGGGQSQQLYQPKGTPVSELGALPFCSGEELPPWASTTRGPVKYDEWRDDPDHPDNRAQIEIPIGEVPDREEYENAEWEIPILETYPDPGEVGKPQLLLSSSKPDGSCVLAFVLNGDCVHHFLSGTFALASFMLALLGCSKFQSLEKFAQGLRQPWIHEY